MDDAVTGIRDLIRARALGIGDALPTEAELAELFGASRNTVREAVRTLKAYGVVASRPKVGAVLIDGRQTAMRNLFAAATEISADMFRDIQGFRRLTEMNLVDRLVGQMPEAALAKMAAANAALAETDDPVAASEYDFAFHMAMIEAAENRTLAEVYGMLKPVICRLMETGKAQRQVLHSAAAEHAAILRALTEGDRIGFLFHMDRHLDAGLQFLPAVQSRQEQQ